MKRTPFSLIEILVVMAVIILLASIVSGAAVFLRRKARATQTEALIKNIETALVQYQTEHGYYPKQTSPGALKMSVLNGLTYSNGRKMIDTTESIFDQSTGADVIDSYGNTVFYLCPGKMNAKTFDIWSMGPDGKHGNNGADVSAAMTANENTDDINNWTRK